MNTGEGYIGIHCTAPQVFIMFEQTLNIYDWSIIWKGTQNQYSSGNLNLT